MGINSLTANIVFALLCIRNINASVFPNCDELTCIDHKGGDIDGTQVADSFGIKTAVNGDGRFIAVGANKFDGDTCTDCGRVVAYEWDTQLNDWVQRGQDIVGTTDNELLSDVDLTVDGNLLAVGSAGFNASRGVVRFYALNASGAWSEVRQPIFGENLGEHSNSDRNYFKLNGAGNIIAVGGTRNDDNGLNDAGYARVFEWDDISSSWAQLGTPIYGVIENGRLGNGMGMNYAGNIISVADYYSGQPGRVRVLQFDGTDWVQVGQTLQGQRAGDRYGFSTSLNAAGNILAIGSHSYDGVYGNEDKRGRAQIYMYDSNSSSWVLLGQTLYGERAGDYFGYRVSLNDNGDVLAVGAFANDDGGQNAGHVRLFQFRDNSWVQLNLDIDGRAARSKSGQSVELSQDASTVIIGGTSAQATTTSAGHVRVFSINYYPEYSVLAANAVDLQFEISDEIALNEASNVIRILDSGNGFIKNRVIFNSDGKLSCESSTAYLYDSVSETMIGYLSNLENLSNDPAAYSLCNINWDGSFSLEDLGRIDSIFYDLALVNQGEGTLVSFSDGNVAKPNHEGLTLYDLLDFRSAITEDSSEHINIDVIISTNGNFGNCAALPGSLQISLSGCPDQIWEISTDVQNGPVGTDNPALYRRQFTTTEYDACATSIEKEGSEIIYNFDALLNTSNITNENFTSSLDAVDCSTEIPLLPIVSIQFSVRVSDTIQGTTNSTSLNIVPVIDPDFMPISCPNAPPQGFLFPLSKLEFNLTVSSEELFSSDNISFTDLNLGGVPLEIAETPTCTTTSPTECTWTFRTVECLPMTLYAETDVLANHSCTFNYVGIPEIAFEYRNAIYEVPDPRFEASRNFSGDDCPFVQSIEDVTVAFNPVVEISNGNNDEFYFKENLQFQISIADELSSTAIAIQKVDVDMQGSDTGTVLSRTFDVSQKITLMQFEGFDYYSDAHYCRYSCRAGFYNSSTVRWNDFCSENRDIFGQPSEEGYVGCQNMETELNLDNFFFNPSNWIFGESFQDDRSVDVTVAITAEVQNCFDDLSQRRRALQINEPTRLVQVTKTFKMSTLSRDEDKGKSDGNGVNEAVMGGIIGCIVLVGMAAVLIVLKHRRKLKQNNILDKSVNTDKSVRVSRRMSPDTIEAVKKINKYYSNQSAIEEAI